MTALKLAHYIITKASKEGYPVNNLQLQKALYLLQKIFLQKGKHAFHENFEAWKMGPIVPEVFFMFNGFGAAPIRMTFSEVDISKEYREVIASILQNLPTNPWELTDHFNYQGSAWDIVYQNGKGNKKTICIELIKGSL